MEILAIVTNCVRVLTVEQVASAWWSDSPWGISRAKSALRELADEGWLKLQPALSRPINELQQPLLTWEPGEAPPNFQSLSIRLHRRAMVPAKLVNIIFATSRSTALFGKGSLPKIKLTQMTHDLHVAQVFLTYRGRGLSVDQWIGEDNFPGSWKSQQRPDGLLRRADGTIYRAIEYGGDYLPQRLMELHQSLANETVRLGYEIW